MVIIRMSRGGAKKRPFYRIVVVDSRKRRDGACLENVGFYNPIASLSDPFRFRLDEIALENWIKKGAKMSSAVERLVKQIHRVDQDVNLTKKI